MENELKVFKNEEFGDIRVLEMNGEPWFVGKDVAIALGYTDANKAVAMHVDEEDKLNDKTALSLGQRGGWLINESGFYSLVLSSKLPDAKRFKRWVTSVVLPSIRKHGGYIAGQEALSDDELLAKAVLVAESKLKERDNQIAALEAKHTVLEAKNAALEAENAVMLPKAAFADAVSNSDSTILVGALAKLLKQNGCNTGPNRLFKWVRENGYLISRKGSDYNMPTQYSMELGLFKIRETAIHHKDGRITIAKTPLVTVKGQQYFLDKFLNQKTT